MSATHVAIPLSTAKQALVALQAHTLELGLYYELVKRVPGTERFHQGDAMERAAYHEQAMRLAVGSAEGETLREVCGPLIDEARSALRTIEMMGSTGATMRARTALDALQRALSTPEGGLPR